MEKEIKAKVIDIAKKILAKEIDPNKGCDPLAALCELNNYINELVIFSLLSHDQRDHEDLGFDLENTAPEIIEEVKKLVAKYT